MEVRFLPRRAAITGILALAICSWAQPVLTDAKQQPPGGITKIQHVVVLMQENRSFDTHFGQLHFEGQPKAAGEPPDASNPDPTNPLAPPIVAFHKTHYCEVADLNHSWNGSHQEWDNGKMDGFTAANVTSSDLNGSRTMGYYDQTDLPYYYGLDKTFATGDHYFQSVLSQTFPNRFYLLAATSFGHIRNDLPTDPSNDFSQKTIFENLDAKGVSWKIYFSQVAFALEFKYVRDHLDLVVTFDDFNRVVDLDRHYGLESQYVGEESDPSA